MKGILVQVYLNHLIYWWILIEAFALFKKLSVLIWEWKIIGRICSDLVNLLLTKHFFLLWQQSSQYWCLFIFFFLLWLLFETDMTWIISFSISFYLKLIEYFYIYFTQAHKLNYSPEITFLFTFYISCMMNYHFQKCDVM